MEGGHRAVIDRIVDAKHAVVLVGEEEIERILPVADLPPTAIEGSWLYLWFSGDDPKRGGVQKIELDEAGTARARERIAGKLALLRERGRSK